MRTSAAGAAQASVSQRLWRRSVCALLLIACLNGCATTGGPSSSHEVSDPIEPVNRAIFSFNMFLDRYLLEPVARAYRFVTPEAARRSVANFLANLRSPVIFANDALQGERERAGITLGRFMINTTLGVAGLFDPATSFGYPRHDEDFGQTLGVWGVASGPYLMLPLLGPSNGRDTVGKVGDYFINPLNHCCITEDERLVPVRGDGGQRARGQHRADRRSAGQQHRPLRHGPHHLHPETRGRHPQRRGADRQRGLRGHLQGGGAPSRHQRPRARTGWRRPPGARGYQVASHGSWPSAGGSWLSRGQREADRGTAERRVLGPDAAAEMLDDLAADGEAEPGALGLVLEQLPLPLTWRNFSKIASR